MSVFPSPFTYNILRHTICTERSEREDTDVYTVCVFSENTSLIHRRTIEYLVLRTFWGNSFIWWMQQLRQVLGRGFSQWPSYPWREAVCLTGPWKLRRSVSLQLDTQFSSVQSLSRVRLFATPWITARKASLSITNSQSSLRLTSIESVMPSSHLILCRPLLLLPPIPPSIRVYSNESILRMRWPKYWSFSFSIIPSKEIPGLISCRMDSLDLLAVQGTL